MEEEVTTTPSTQTIPPLSTTTTTAPTTATSEPIPVQLPVPQSSLSEKVVEISVKSQYSPSSSSTTSTTAETIALSQIQVTTTSSQSPFSSTCTHKSNHGTTYVNTNDIHSNCNSNRSNSNSDNITNQSTLTQNNNTTTNTAISATPATEVGLIKTTTQLKPIITPDATEKELETIITVTKEEEEEEEGGDDSKVVIKTTKKGIETTTAAVTTTETPTATPIAIASQTAAMEYSKSVQLFAHSFAIPTETQSSSTTTSREAISAVTATTSSNQTNKNSRPRRTIKQVIKYQPSTLTYQQQLNYQRQAGKVGSGFLCPQCNTHLSYDAKFCWNCNLRCCYVAGTGVVICRERERIVVSNNELQQKQQQYSLNQLQSDVSHTTTTTTAVAAAAAVGSESNVTLANYDLNPHPTKNDIVIEKEKTISKQKQKKRKRIQTTCSTTTNPNVTRTSRTRTTRTGTRTSSRTKRNKHNSNPEYEEESDMFTFEPTAVSTVTEQTGIQQNHDNDDIDDDGDNEDDNPITDWNTLSYDQLRDLYNLDRTVVKRGQTYESLLSYIHRKISKVSSLNACHAKIQKIKSEYNHNMNYTSNHNGSSGGIQVGEDYIHDVNGGYYSYQNIGNGSNTDHTDHQDYINEHKLYLRGLRERAGKAASEALEKMTFKSAWEDHQRKLAYENRTKKKTIEEIELERLLQRPFQFIDGKYKSESRNGSTRSSSVSVGRSKIGANTRRSKCKIGEDCGLCNGSYATYIITDEEIQAAGNNIVDSIPIDISGSNQPKEIRHLSFCYVTDKDIPDDRCDDNKKEQSTKRRSNRVSNAIHESHWAEYWKLIELKHSMEFIREYNKGLLQSQKIR